MAARPGGDRRGKAKDRRRRKEWMLKQWGNGKTCPCVHCQADLTFATVEADRVDPAKGYRRDNVQPSCRRCNASRGNSLKWMSSNPLSYVRLEKSRIAVTEGAR